MFQNLKLQDFMMFPRADFTFGEHLNIIIGENGTGKTHLLKLLFAISKLTEDISDRDFVRPILFNDTDNSIIGAFKQVFRVKQLRELIRFTPEHNLGMSKSVNSINMGDSQHNFGFVFTIAKAEPNSDSIFVEKTENVNLPQKQKSNVIFIPARELLSMYQNFRSLNDEYDLPYDKTVVDTISKLGLPYLKNESKEFTSLIKSIESVMDGKIFLRDEKFYYHPNSAPFDMDLDISMAAEGWRKLGMILQLLQNGSLRKGKVLLWDEPEANLNPLLIQLMANAIVELSRQNIQVFITTHSLFLLNELEIILAKRKITDGVRFFNLRNGKAPQQGNTFSALKNTLLLDEAMKQSDRYLNEEV